jgi:hypothetical protein
MSFDISGAFRPKNRISASAERYRVKVELALSSGKDISGRPTTKEHILGLSKADSDREVMAFQSIQSKAFASGILSEEEASWLYQKLGREIPTKKKFNELPVWDRIAIMQTMDELLRRLGR